MKLEKIQREGTAAVNLGLPLLYFYLGVGIMIGVGGIAQAGIALGGGLLEKCNQIFREAIALTTFVTVGVTVIVATIFYPVTALFHIDEMTLKYFQQYYFIIIFELPLLIINNNLGMFIRGEGKPQVSMMISILSLLLNTILDYLAIRVLHLGIAGIAMSSLISVMICLIISLLFFVNVQMIMIGIGQGMTPLVSFVYGAKDVGTARKLCKVATISGTLVGTVAFIVMLLGRNVYSQFFIKNMEIQQMISMGILIFAGSFLLVGFNTMASFYYTSIGYAKESAVISTARGLVILLIALFVLPKFFGMTGVWLVAPVTEIITVMICLGYYAKGLDIIV